VERAVELANRVSVNLEAGNPKDLQMLAPDKDFTEDLFSRMRWIDECMRRRESLCRGHTTQFIVGATPESDRGILQTVSNLYRDIGLERAYFSAFQPIAGTPLEGALPAPLMREHRLYQADFLLRRYHWKQEEFIFQADGNLSLKEDPKMIWARNHPERYPVEINRAELAELLRVPGIGPKSARRILSSRKRGRLNTLGDLRSIGAVARRAAPFVLLNGRPQAEPAGQLALL
jgi:predicted DNA-binding helix-hairpin-helix protein